MTTWTNREKPFDGLITEDGRLFTTEDGLWFIVYDFVTDWTKRLKNITTSWGNRTKPTTSWTNRILP